MFGKASFPIAQLACASLFALTAGTAYAADWDSKPRADLDAGGDKTKRPIVFVHGASGSGEQFERQALYFTSNGYPVSWVTTFDYSTGGGGGRGGARGTRGAAAGGAARGGAAAAADGAAAASPAAGGAAAAPAAAAPAAAAAGRRGRGGAGAGRGARGGRGGGAAADGAAAAVPAAAAPATAAAPGTDAAAPAPAAGARRGRGAGGGGADSAITLALDKFVDEVRARTGFDKVDLVAHSRGTSESAAFLRNPARAAKIAHYVAIGGGAATNPNGVASLAISGLGDNGNGPSASNGGEVAWMPAYQDHVMVAESDESFWATYTFLNDGKKPLLKVTPEERPQVGGYVKSYVINKPLSEATVEVWEVAAATGLRTKEKPLVSLDVQDNGQFGPFSADPKQHYEFVVKGTASPTSRRFFREPFTHTDMLMYLRIPASAEGYSPSPWDSMEGLLSDKSASFYVRHEDGAFLQGVTKLTVNGIDVVVDPIVPLTNGPRQTPNTNFYLADGNNNGKSDLGRITGFSNAFSVSGDIFIPADGKTVTFQLNNHVLNVPALAGKDNGPISVIFMNRD